MGDPKKYVCKHVKVLNKHMFKTLNNIPTADLSSHACVVLFCCPAAGSAPVPAATGVTAMRR